MYVLKFLNKENDNSYMKICLTDSVIYNTFTDLGLAKDKLLLFNIQQ